MNATLPTALVLACATFAGAACAQVNESNENPLPQDNASVPMSNDMSFDRLDANDDGFLEKSELMGNPGVAQNFAQIDSDGDGKLSPSEWKMQGKHEGDDVDREDDKM